jgi:hypothetical protein
MIGKTKTKLRNAKMILKTKNPTDVPRPGSVTNPEDLLHEFLTITRLKIAEIRSDGASEVGKSSSSIAHCQRAWYCLGARGWIHR